MPSYSLFIRSELTDFDQWLNPDPSVPEGLFRDAGGTYTRLTRDVGNPNMITIEGRFPTEEAARSFDELGRSMNGEWKNFNAKPGGIYETWIAQAVEGYEFDLTA